jgi:SAM-dependent methyltransferase
MIVHPPQNEIAFHNARPEYAYYLSADQMARIQDLMAIIPRGRSSVLDVGCRDGYISGLLLQFFSAVSAVDVNKPTFSIERVTPVQGDATNLHLALRIESSPRLTKLTGTSHYNSFPALQDNRHPGVCRFGSQVRQQSPRGYII